MQDEAFPFARHALALVGPELARDLRVGVQRSSSFSQLIVMQLLKSRAVDPGGELRRLLVALNERPLDFLLIRENQKG